MIALRAFVALSLLLFSVKLANADDDIIKIDSKSKTFFQLWDDAYRDEARFDLGFAYVLEPAGSWKQDIELAFKGNSRQLGSQGYDCFMGTVDFRYRTVSSTTDQEQTDTTNFNPFKSDGGILSLDAYETWYLLGAKKIPAGLVGGFGFSSVPSSDTGATVTLKTRYFAGFRYDADYKLLTVESEGQKQEDLRGNGYFQAGWLWDDGWKKDNTKANERYFVEGEVAFQALTNLRARIIATTPRDGNGDSEVRASILYLYNFLQKK